MARPTKPLISRNLAVSQAIKLIDTEGLESFSLPRLARRMGVRAPSLYYHFADKADILTEISRWILQECPIPPFDPQQRWQDWCVSTSLNVRAVILQHRNAAPLVVRYLPRDTLIALYEGVAKYLTESGVPSEQLVLILDGLERLTIAPAAAEAMRDPASRIKVFANVDSHEHPYLRKALAANKRNPERLFEETLRAFLIGIEITSADSAGDSQPHSRDSGA